MTAILILILGTVVGALAYWLLSVMRQRDTAQSRLAEELTRRTIAENESVFNQTRAAEWRQQAIETSRRNHELTNLLANATELLARAKKQELIDVDEVIEHPPSVLEADREAARERRAVATADKHVRPPAPAPVGNNDDQDDVN